MEKKKNADGCHAKSSKDTQGMKILSKNKTKSGKLEPVEEPPDLPPLSQGWKAYKSKNRPDKLYYFNEKTGETSWQRPNSAPEDSQRQTENHPGSSKTAASTPAQRKRVQKLVKKAKRSPEKVKKQTTPEVAIIFEKRAAKNIEQQSANVVSKTPPKSENHSAASSSIPRKRRSNIDTADSSSKKPKSEQRALVKSPSVTDMEVTTTALSDDNELNHGSPMNDGMTLSGWLESHKDDAQSESMDWETSTSAVITFPGVICHDNSWHVVIDTNVLLQNLDFVQHLRDSNYEGFGIVVVIPWVVLQELDHFKSNNSKKPHLQPLARKAISFIHCTLKSQHPRLIGQFCHASRDNVSNDDEILHHCLEIRSKDKKVMLLTEDKNLCNKAVISNVECQSVQSLRQWLSLESPSCPMGESNQNEDGDVKISLQADPWNEIVNSAKSVMVTFFGHVLTKEMQSKFGEMWMRIVLKKPPWHFKDLMLCLEKHWIAALSEVFARPAEKIIKSILKLRVFNNQNSWRALKKDEVEQALDICISLCHSVICNHYTSRRDTAVKELKALRQLKVTTPQSSPKSLPTSCKELPILPNKAKIDRVLIPEDLDKVISCFNKMWNNVLEFCTEVRSMLQLPDQVLVNKIEAKIMTYYRFLKSFLQINERLIFVLVMVGSECDIDDLTEMRRLLLNSPANEGADPHAASFSLLALKNFYLSKREEMLQARERLEHAMGEISMGLNFLMVVTRQT